MPHPCARTCSFPPLAGPDYTGGALPALAEPEKKDFGLFYRATVAPLRRYLARMVRSQSDAEDLSHDAYQRVYRAMDKQDVQKPEAFLYTAARRLALNRIRRKQIAPVRDVGGDDKVIDLAASTSPRWRGVLDGGDAAGRRLRPRDQRHTLYTDLTYTPNVERRKLSVGR